MTPTKSLRHHRSYPPTLHRNTILYSTSPTHTPMPATPPHKHHYTSLRSLIRTKDNGNPSAITDSLGPRPSRNSSSSRSRERRPDPLRKADRDKDKGRLSTWKLMCLTVSMGGSQIAWTVYALYNHLQLPADLVPANLDTEHPTCSPLASLNSSLLSFGWPGLYPASSPSLSSVPFQTPHTLAIGGDTGSQHLPCSSYLVDWVWLSQNLSPKL